MLPYKGLKIIFFIWDNHTQRDAELLEAVQLDIARTAFGARKCTSHELLYVKINWHMLAQHGILQWDGPGLELVVIVEGPCLELEDG